MIKNKSKIVCLGLITVDIIVTNVVTNMFEHDTVIVNDAVILSGGDANNQAIALGKLGMNVSLLARVGNDIFGHIALERLKMFKVDISGIIVDDNFGTSVSVVLVNSTGGRVFLYKDAGNNNIGLEQIDLNVLNDAAILCVGSLWGLPGLDGCKITQIFEYAKKNGVIIVADATYDAKSIGIEPMKKAVKNVDYFLPSQCEAEAITGEKDPELAARALLDIGPKVVVIKLGANGCLIAKKDRMIHIPAFPVKPVDTTGAGDNFTAGFITKLYQNADLYECGKFACAVGALSTQVIGANTANISFARVKEFIKNQKS